MNSRIYGSRRKCDFSPRNPYMKVPKVGDSLSWRKQKERPFTSKDVSEEHGDHEEAIPQPEAGLSANRLAAKAFRLRMQGKDHQSDKLMQDVELSNRELPDGDASEKEHIDGRSRRSYFAKHILTQQERCPLCFENPNRRKHLVVSIGNFTYLMLPQRQPVVPGHCCIITMQHESATRSIDNHVWDEMRNFKKCLIMMFARQEKDVIFLETVMDLAQQRHHCLVECIPIPREIATEASLYFKKAIDEAEDDWSQHNAKKLIDTGVKGLRASIPKDFPYFHVEFGLDKGFVHVIDDEKQFDRNLGLNVIRGMLQLPEEDMHRQRRYELAEVQKQAVASFARDWEPFDWTKQLD